jgi:hypothetical protein
MCYSSRINCRILRTSLLKRQKLSLYVINEAAHNEDVCGSRGIAPLFLISTLDGSEWSRLSGPQGQSGRCGVQKNLLPCWELNPGHPAHSLLLCQLSYPSSLLRFCNHCFNFPLVRNCATSVTNIEIKPTKLGTV